MGVDYTNLAIALLLLMNGFVYVRIKLFQIEVIKTKKGNRTPYTVTQDPPRYD